MKNIKTKYLSLSVLVCFINIYNLSFTKKKLLSGSIIIENDNSDIVEEYNNDVEIALTLSNYNMVNYNINNKVITFENFDVNNYVKRNSLSNTYNVQDNYTNGVDIELKTETIDGIKIEYTEPYFPNEVSLFSTGGIYGTDNREEIEDPSNMPYSPTGQIVSYYKTIYEGVEIKNVESSTGFLEGPNVLATAAHSVFKDVTTGEYDDNIFNPIFPYKVEFYPSRNGTIIPYTSNAIKINISKEYYNSTSVENDWAVIELDNNIGNYTGWYGKIANWYIKGQSASSYGYPVNKDSKMWASSGEIKGKTDYYYKTSLDVTNGQSGSGVSITYNGGEYMCGIISHHEENIFGQTSYTGATRINSFIFHYLNSYVASNIQWPTC